MSGPNGDPNIPSDDGIIEDEDEFNEEGNTGMFQMSMSSLHL